MSKLPQPGPGRPHHDSYSKPTCVSPGLGFELAFVGIVIVVVLLLALIT